MKIDRYIDCESALVSYHSDLHARGVESVALDMEGDQGSIRYAYSISIFQCFDGVESAIIDVLSIGNIAALNKFLTDPAITKVMFSCANDIFMTQNILGSTIAPVRDIAVGQHLLGLPTTIADYLDIDKNQKDRFQRANWLRRPIKKELLDYAINDVLNLLNIEQEITKKLRLVNKYDEYINGSEQLTAKNFLIDHFTHYKAKFPHYKRLKPAQRKAAATAWIFRELFGKHYDVPVGYILSKKAMCAIIKEPDNMVQALINELNRGRAPDRLVRPELVENLYRKAVIIMEKEETVIPELVGSE